MKFNRIDIFRIEYACPRSEPNSNTFKILKNETIKFKERAYTAFNVSLKKVNFRKL